MTEKKTARATISLSEDVYIQAQNHVEKHGLKFSNYIQRLIEDDLAATPIRSGASATILTDLAKELGGEYLREQLAEQLRDVDQRRELVRILYARAGKNWKLPPESLTAIPHGLLTDSEIGDYFQANPELLDKMHEALKVAEQPGGYLARKKQKSRPKKAG